ncbi:Crp/Fnr family transcriptional regulator [Paenibacillus sp. J2TS4]|uniref:Crp/Fnr family transcriptional regulator n=1 Tax=Paenibacillus sp. J2TS4 TaxID=2807194 RepID=UPI001AFD1339|nr:Crp/Fnr family transcriptional regulator [Paenibacillus sp. J2TS4]GIP33349.1 catabolite gene activator [Paenibacillus sp. J2TS4]
MKEVFVFLRDFPFFQDLEEEDLEKIAPLFIKRTYDKGVNVFLEEGEGDELYIIQSGVVKIYKVDDSREIILAIFRDGDFFGEMAVLQNEQTRSASAKTMEKTTVYVLKRRDFVALMNKSPQISIKILKTALDRLRKANEFITDLTILDARTRIARVLLRLTEKHGVRQKSGIIIDLKLTHQQIADMTGTVRETVTKIMLELQNQQMIRVDKKKISICDVAKLERLAGAT